MIFSFYQIFFFLICLAVIYSLLITYHHLIYYSSPLLSNGLCILFQIGKKINVIALKSTSTKPLKLYNHTYRNIVIKTASGDIGYAKYREEVKNQKKKLNSVSLFLHIMKKKD